MQEVIKRTRPMTEVIMKHNPKSHLQRVKKPHLDYQREEQDSGMSSLAELFHGRKYLSHLTLFLIILSECGPKFDFLACNRVASCWDSSVAILAVRILRPFSWNVWHHIWNRRNSESMAVFWNIQVIEFSFRVFQVSCFYTPDSSCFQRSFTLTSKMRVIWCEGTDLYRERLVSAVARELQVPLLKLDSSILPPYVSLEPHSHFLPTLLIHCSLCWSLVSLFNRMTKIKSVSPLYKWIRT